MLRLLLGTLLGLAALWAAFRGQSFDVLLDAIAQAHGAWVVLALTSLGATLWLGTIRWRVLFGRPGTEPDQGPAPSLGVLFTALILGQATNIALPIRVGELLRIYAASRAGSVPVSGVLATVVVERLADMVMMAIGAMVLVLYATLPGWLEGPSRALAVAGLVAGGIIVVIVTGGRRLSVWIRSRVAASVSKSRTIQRLARHGALAVEEAANLSDWRTLARVGVLSVLILACSVSTNYLLFRAFDMTLPFVAALLLLLVLTVGTAPVSSPGNLGVFQYLTVLALGVYSVDGTKALAYSMVLYAVALGPKLVIGAVLLAVGMRRGLIEPGIWEKLRGRA